MSWIKKCNVYLGYMVDIPVTVIAALPPAPSPPGQATPSPVGSTTTTSLALC